MLRAVPRIPKARPWYYGAGHRRQRQGCYGGEFNELQSGQKKNGRPESWHTQ
jgi:hypothetical protein